MGLLLLRTGIDKQYVQIFDIDFTSFGTFTGIFGFFDGTYDGNNLFIQNMTLGVPSPNVTSAIFTSSSAETVFIKNCKLDNISKIVTESSGTQGILLTVAGPSSIVENIHMTNSTMQLSGPSPSAARGRSGGILGAAVNATVNNCSFQGTLSNESTVATPSGFGGVVGYAENNCTLTNLRTFDSTITGQAEVGGVIGDSTSVTAGNTVSDIICETTTVNATSSVVGGAVGYFRRGTISRVRSSATVNQTGGTFGCGGAIGVLFGATPIATEIFSSGSVNCSAGGSHAGTGGCVGIVRSATLSNSYATGNVSGATQVGGLVGQLRQGTITNCYSTGVPSGTSGVGGMVGVVVSSGTSNASYWDTDTSGTVTSIRGTGQTTVALQTPTSNTGIYSAWSLAIWDFGTSVEYPSLTTTP